MRQVTVRETERGFTLVNFTDRYGQKCSLQKSSLAMEEAIWLGVDEAIITEQEKAMGVVKKGHRMHLTRMDVQRLLPLLQHFALTGNLPLTDELNYIITLFPEGKEED